MGFARNQENAEPIAHAVNRNQRTIVFGRQFLAISRDRNLQNGLAAMIEREGNRLLAADRNGMLLGFSGIFGDGKLHRAPGLAILILDADLDLQFFADDAVTRRLLDDQAAVAFALAPA